MNTYTIWITPVAQRDILQAADYITNVLKNPTAADNLLQSVQTHINSLSAMPERFPLVDEPILKSWGIRLLIIQNYYVIYTISENTHQVIIIRFLSVRRNWMSILKENPFDN